MEDGLGTRIVAQQVAHDRAPIELHGASAGIGDLLAIALVSYGQFTLMQVHDQAVAEADQQEDVRDQPEQPGRWSSICTDSISPARAPRALAGDPELFLRRGLYPASPRVRRPSQRRRLADGAPTVGALRGWRAQAERAPVHGTAVIQVG